MRAALTGLGVLAALAALPSAAGAKTFCTGPASAGCPAGAVDEGRFRLQKALDDAKESPGPDTILVAADEFPYEGGFVYEAAADNPVTITAAGAGRPEIAVDPTATGFTLDQATVRGIDIRMARGSTGAGIAIAGGRIEDVAVLGDGGTGSGTGISVSGKSTIERTRISPAITIGLVVGAQAELEGDSIDVRNAAFGILVFGGSARLTATRVSAVTTALRATAAKLGERPHVTVSRSTFVTTGPGSIGVLLVDAVSALSHVTVAKQGAGNPQDTAAMLIAGAQGGQALLRSGALSGYAHGLTRSAAGTKTLPLVVEDSVWAATGDTLGGAAAGDFTESRNVHADPALVDPAGGDLRPRAGSPAIDRDRFLAPTSYVDFDGLPAVDGDGDGEVLADAGALEFRPPAPPASPAGDAVPAGGDPVPPAGGVGTPPPPARDSRAPRLAKLRLSTKRVRVGRTKTLRLRFTLDERATLRVEAKRRVRGRTVAVRGAAVLKAPAGPGDVALAKALRRLKVLRPGTVTLVVTATDAAGNRSTPRSVRLALRS